MENKNWIYKENPHCGRTCMVAECGLIDVVRYVLTRSRLMAG